MGDSINFSTNFTNIYAAWLDKEEEQETREILLKKSLLRLSFGGRQYVSFQDQPLHIQERDKLWELLDYMDFIEVYDFFNFTHVQKLNSYSYTPGQNISGWNIQQDDNSRMEIFAF